jgi:hypothetical protein
MNKYKCTIYGCENIMSAPEFKASDGICRDHRKSFHTRAREGWNNWDSPQMKLG